MKRALKWIGRGLLVIIVLAVVAVGAIYLLSENAINRVYAVEVAAVNIPSDTASIGAGEAWYGVRGCSNCHTASGGGEIMIENPVFGRIVAPNITTGGVTADYTAEDWVRTIRHGVAPDGTGLVIMPSNEFFHLSDEEIGQIAAYVSSLPPVENSLPSISIALPARAIFLTNGEGIAAAHIDHAASTTATIPQGITVERGAYLAWSCVGCHGENLAGGIDGGAPGGLLSANLTLHPSGLAGWREQDFIQSIRSGTRPDGSIIDAGEMPWAEISVYSTDEDLQALWVYLESLPPLPEGTVD